MRHVKAAILMALGTTVLAGCANEPRTTYNPNDFITPNKVVTHKVQVSVIPAVHATYGIGNDPSVVKAYQQYSKTGNAPVMREHGWVTYPYSINSKPIISCAELRLCVVQLEAGEQVQSIGLGDSSRWMTKQFKTGTGAMATTSIAIKPNADGIATDMTISTDKRTYMIGLVSQAGQNSTVLRYYYPQETLVQTIKNAKQNHSSNQVVSTQAQQGTHISLNTLNFAYHIRGDHPAWRPLRVYDDGNKTYIQMPSVTSKMSLPVLYLARDKQLQMVNFRYDKPYFVIDGLFSKAWLVSGKGSDQVRVELINNKMQ